MDRILQGLIEQQVPFIRVGSLKKIARNVLPYVLSARHGTKEEGIG